MPQARRKTPFSGKAKKQQLQSKKQNRQFVPSGSATSSTLSADTVVTVQSTKRAERNRYALRFHRESDQELQRKKEDAMREVTRLDESALEILAVDYFPPELSFPQRPPWNFDMSRLQLDMHEQKYFTEYVNGLQKLPLWQQVSYFELNLETWRQLWRVMEMSDVLLIIVDIRFPAMMFPPTLYRHVVETCGKDMILVLNKIDLVPAALVAAWRQYFLSAYPALKVLYFTSCPSYNLRGQTADKAGLLIRRRKGRQRMAAEGATKLLEACRELVGDRVDLTSWEQKIKEESQSEYDESGPEIGESLVDKADTSYYSQQRFEGGVLTIGCVGQPNVGKSSLMNSIMGKKVVSVSSTPGHTKHFQTIFLTPQVRLCDCPGLVFPSLVPRTVQILMGSYPIAQLREPYSTIRYLAERLDLPSILRIQHPEGDTSWSPRDICDGWARKRGYFTAKAARLDSYRAANALLRMALDGRICLALRPSGFTAEKDKWESDSEVPYIRWVQALTEDEPSGRDGREAGSSDESLSGETTETGGDDESSNSEPTAVVNKFAALLAD